MCILYYIGAVIDLILGLTASRSLKADSKEQFLLQLPVGTSANSLTNILTTTAHAKNKSYLHTCAPYPFLRRFWSSYYTASWLTPENPASFSQAIQLTRLLNIEIIITTKFEKQIMAESLRDM